MSHVIVVLSCIETFVGYVELQVRNNWTSGWGGPATSKKQL